MLDVGASVATHEKDSGQDVTYPIFIDPDWSAGAQASWYTDAAYPDQSYLNASTSDVLRMGRYQNFRGNIFYQFIISPLAGKDILGAQLGATQIRWASCPNSPVQVRAFGPQAGGFTWNQQNHSLWGPVLDTQNPGSCSSGPEAVGWNVTAGVQAYVGQTWFQLGLAPQNETVVSRRHFSRAATLTVSYNTRPNAPTDPVFTSPSRQCGTAAAPTPDRAERRHRSRAPDRPRPRQCRHQLPPHEGFQPERCRSGQARRARCAGGTSRSRSPH
ncbi:hypothetical protein JM654_19820 [Microbacterium oxydans]|nr:hypothetical protein [Microbacterium oxydans]